MRLIRAGFSPVAEWPSLYFHARLRLLLAVYVDDFKMAGKAESIAPMWEKVGKLIELDPSVPLKGTTYLVCTQFETEPNVAYVTRCQQMHHDLIHSTMSNTIVHENEKESSFLPVASLSNCRAYHHEVTGHSHFRVENIVKLRI